jgi:tellurite resistance protein
LVVRIRTVPLCLNLRRRSTFSKEHDIVMKKAFALAVLAVCALPAGAGAQNNAADPAKMVQMFSVPLKLDGATMQVIILNDRTVEALFPQSQA